MRIFAKNPTVPTHQMKQQPSSAIVLELFIPIKMWNSFVFLFSQNTFMKICHFAPYYRELPRKGMANGSSQGMNNIAAADPK